jgi:PAS domain S-box-containing protein
MNSTNFPFHENLEFIISAAKIGLWRWEMDTGMVICSPEWEAAAGYSPGELNQKADAWMKMIDPGDVPAMEAIIKRHIAGETPDFQIEFRMKRKDGSMIWAQSKGAITERHDDGRPRKFGGVIQDVTKFKRIESDHIKKTEERLQSAMTEIENYNRHLNKKIEEGVAALAEAKLTSESLYNSNPNVNIVVNDKMEILDCNPMALEFYGFPTKQDFIDHFLSYISTCIPEYMPDGQRGVGLAERFAQVKEKGEIIFETLLNIRGEEIPFNFLMRQIRYKDGWAVAVYQTDLRRLRKAEINLERQDRLLSTVNSVASKLISAEQTEFVSAIHDSLATLGRTAGVDRVYIWENHRKDNELYCTQIFEWSEGAEPQQGNKYTTDIKYDESIPTWKDTMLAGKSINNIVREMNRAERDQLEPQGIVSILVLPIYLQNEFWGFIGFDDCRNERVFTATEESILKSAGLLIAVAMMRNEMTTRLRDAAAKMEAVIKNYNGVIWSVDQDNVVTMFNGLFLHKLGVAPGFLEGKNLEAARKRNRHLDMISNIEKTFTDGPQDWVSDIDGAMYRSHTRPIYHENGQVSGVVGSTHDITDSIKLQKELEQAVEAAQSASRAKSNFLSNMSHEMRTPMNAIIGMTAIGKSAADISRKDYAFDRIESASTHLLGVINDILDMSKIEASKFELSYTEFNFEKLLQNVINVVNFRVDDKKQQFDVSIDNRIPRRLIGDEQRLAQVITNLLSNSVKFTPEGGSIHLDAQWIKIEDHFHTIQIEVSDNGIGIMPEQQSRLFSSFEQAESSTSRKFGGTGLGLAISKHIVEMMGGSIWVESEPGKGSVFGFTIQMKRAESASSELLPTGVNREKIHSESFLSAAEAGCINDTTGKDAPAEENMPDTNNFKGCCVLLAEDVDINREIVITLLESTGLGIDCAVNGIEAVRMFSENPDKYDVILMDIQMPEMDGLEATRRIRELDAEWAKQVPVVALTANVFREDIEKCLENGMNDHLGKPLDFDKVMEKLRKYLL